MALERCRVDATPENVNWRDTGCDVSPSCLACPLERCKYEEDGHALKRERFAARNAEIVAAHEAGVTAREIGIRYGMAKRSVLRVIQLQKAR